MFYLQLTLLHTSYLLLSDCMCNADGSVDNSCDENGKCSCNANVAGEKCDQCAAGVVEFPSCDKCSPDHYDFPDCKGKQKQKYNKIH